MTDYAQFLASLEHFAFTEHDNSNETRKVDPADKSGYENLPFQGFKNPPKKVIKHLRLNP